MPFNVISSYAKGLLLCLSLCFLHVGCAEKELDFNKFGCTDCPDTLIERAVSWSLPLGYTSINLSDYLDTLATIRRDNQGNYFYEKEQEIFKATLNASNITASAGGGSASHIFVPSTTEDTVTRYLSIPISMIPTDISLKEARFEDTLVASITPSIANAKNEIRISLLSGGAYTTIFSGVIANQTDIPIPLSVHHFSGNDKEFSLQVFIEKKSAQDASYQFDVNFKSLKWTYLRGYLGKSNFFRNYDVFTHRDTILGGVKISFERFHPRESYIEISSQNKNIGIPIKIDGRHLFLGKNGSDTIQSIIYDNYPTEKDVVSTYSQRFTDKVSDFLAKIPDEIEYQGRFLFNEHQSKDRDTNQFIANDGEYSMKSRLHIPLYFSELGRLEIREIIGTNIGEIDSSTIAIDSMRMFVQGVSFFPCDMDLRIYFIDATKSAYDSVILDNKPIKAAALDADGNVVKETPFATDFPLSRDQVYKFKNLKSISIKAVSSIVDTDPSATFSTRNYIKVGMGLRAALRIKLKTK